MENLQANHLNSDLLSMALEELSRHFGIKNPDQHDIKCCVRLMRKMPIIKAAFENI